MYKDITKNMEKFRLASRDLRNRYFLQEDGDSLIIAHEYSSVEEVLFNSLIVKPLCLSNALYGFLRTDLFVAVNDEAPVMINRSPELNYGYWDNSVNRVAEKSKLQFVRYFDFNQNNYADNSYVMFYINESLFNTSIESHFGLVRKEYCHFFVNKKIKPSL